MKNKVIGAIILMVMLFILTGCSDMEVNTISTSEIQVTDEIITVTDEIITVTDEIITVTDKWVKRTDERDLYLVGTENEVFKIEDNIFVGKFNSSDIYNKIKVGSKYRITTTGVRNNFMSWYRNINTIEEVK